MKNQLRGTNNQVFLSLTDYNAREAKRLERNFKVHLSEIKKKIDQLKIKALQKKLGNL